MKPPKVEDKLERFRQFWQRAPTDRPVLGVRLQSLYPLQTFQGGPRSGVVTPDQLGAEDYFDDYERLYAMYACAVGDQIYVASAFYGVPWLEAILGCEVEVRGDTMWAGPHLDDWADLNTIRFDPSNPWFVKLLELTEEIVKHAGGRYPVGITLLRGPGDVASALRGANSFCMDIFDEPDNVEVLLDVCADTYIQVTRALFEKCTWWYGGYAEPIRHVWAPGYCCETQADVSTLLSPDHYREFLRPRDARVLHAYDYCFIHLHTSSLHILEEVLAIEPIAAVELSVDVDGPRPIEYLDDLKKVLARTPLILQGEFTVDEIVQLCKRLPSEGLYILALADSPEEGNALLEEAFGTLGYTTG